MFNYLFFAAAIFCGVLGLPQPPVPCGREDNKCLTSLAQVLYLAPFQTSQNELDPMIQKIIPADGPTYNMTLTDSTITGFKSCEIKDTSITADKLSIKTIMFCPRFHMEGNYEVDGTLASMLFQGKGPYTLTTTNYDVTLDVKLETTIRDGKKYTKVADYKVDGDLKGDLDLKLNNLYDGNTELSDKFHKYINENTKLVAKILQPPVFHANFGRLVESFNKNLGNMPVDGFIA